MQWLLNSEFDKCYYSLGNTSANLILHRQKEPIAINVLTRARTRTIVKVLVDQKGKRSEEGDDVNPSSVKIISMDRKGAEEGANIFPHELTDSAESRLLVVNKQDMAKEQRKCETLREIIELLEDTGEGEKGGFLFEGGLYYCASKDQTGMKDYNYQFQTVTESKF